MSRLHRLLTRQLKKAALNDEQVKAIAPLLQQVNEAYYAFDNDLNSIENILEKSSQELYTANQNLKKKVAFVTGQLSNVVGNIKDVIFEMNLKGEWTYLNPAWEELTGIPVDEALGTTYHSVLNKDIGEALLHKFQSYNFEYQIFRDTVEFTTKYHEKKWLEFSIKPVQNDSGSVRGYIGTIVNITDLKHTEFALIKANEEATKANRSKDDFLSTMSHEIRTPLNAVIGISNLLLLEDPKTEQLENLNVLKYSSEHLLDLVNDILDFNKMASGSFELEEADFDLDELLKAQHSIFYKKAVEKNITFKIEKVGDMPNIVIGDSVRIRQILTNLVGNAIKFTNEGEVALNVSLQGELNDHYQINFAVTDTGIGIPKAKREKIFQPFAQASRHTTRKFGGTGLGLAICSNLVKVMGSSLLLKSQEGKGSTFSFTLQLKKGKNIKKFDKTSGSQLSSERKFVDFSGSHVLVVEDNKVNVMVLKKFLKRWNINFDIAENGLVAMQMTSSKNYDLILMDIQMPVMNGFEAIDRIREGESPLNKDTPIYVLSASTSSDFKNKIKINGINGFLGKPFNPQDLYEVMSVVLNKPKVLH